MKPHPQLSGRGAFARKAEGIYQYETSGNYYAVFTFKGQRIKQRLGNAFHPCSSLPEAKRLLGDLKRSLERTEVDSSKKTLGMIIEEYRSIMPFSEGSKGYKSQYLDELGKAFPKNQKVAALKTSDMTRHIASYQERMAPATINKVITLLRDVFRHALHDRAIAFSPMEGIKYQKNRDTKKRLIPTLGEFEAIVESIRSQSLSDTAKESGDLVEFMGLAGLGQAECAGLKWGDINFQSGIITIIRAKTGHQFDFPIYPTLRPLLDRLHAQRPKEAQGGPQNATDPVFHVYNPKVALENACARLGLPNYTARSLRRMHITRCLELGIDPQTIAAWQGHRDGGQLILRTYGRVSKAHQMNMAARLSPKITTMAQGGLAGQA